MNFKPSVLKSQNSSGLGQAQLMYQLAHPNKNVIPGILVISSYPPRECGIATYSHDLIKAIRNKFGDSFKIEICALECKNEVHTYPEEVSCVLKTDEPESYVELAHAVNKNPDISLVVLQHEFGFFAGNEEALENLLLMLEKPVITCFHTVLPRPDIVFRTKVLSIIAASHSLIVMTKFSENILISDYEVAAEKITVIAHGTHLVPYANKKTLKKKYGLTGKKVLSTFGLLSSGKSIETTLDALPDIIKLHPDVVFLVLGKTHPNVVKQEGEVYRNMLESKVINLGLEEHVRFLNYYQPLPDLLDYLQLTDIYLFTSKDPNQAVSGTFSYAISCGCPVISTPIPHAREVLQHGAGIIFDFGRSDLLAKEICKLLSSPRLRKNLGANGIHMIAPTAWENAAIAHSLLFEKVIEAKFELQYKLPPINLKHIRKLTTEFGMLQFSVLNKPDLNSGYTLDDNARALIALCKHYELSNDKKDPVLIGRYYALIKTCLQSNNSYLNYQDRNKAFTHQNGKEGLEDAHGRAVWALGYLLSVENMLPADVCVDAEEIFQRSLTRLPKIHSCRAMAFAIKGLYYSQTEAGTEQNSDLVKLLANRLLQMYRHESEEGWNWFESSLTYANSVLPEAMLCAYELCGDDAYKEAALNSFHFLLSKTFTGNEIHVITNKGWLQKTGIIDPLISGGEQPIDVAYTILALDKFHKVFGDAHYLCRMKTAFDWFLGKNHLNRIIYNPCTGGCYDGLEEFSVNLNQGAESAVSYLMARLTMEKSLGKLQKAKTAVHTDPLPQPVFSLVEGMRAKTLDRGLKPFCGPARGKRVVIG